MRKYVCDRCDAEMETSDCKVVKTQYLIGGPTNNTELCPKCNAEVENYLKGHAPFPACEDATTLLPLAEMVKRLIEDVGWSLTLKYHCCNSCLTDKLYESDEVVRYHLIQLQHAFIDYMEEQNG